MTARWRVATLPGGLWHLRNWGGFSGFFSPKKSARECGKGSPVGGQGVPYLLFVALVLLVDAVCRTGIADGLQRVPGRG